MKKYQLDLKVISNVPVSDDTFMLDMTGSRPLPDVIPGQFAELLVEGSSSTFLRRPISIHDVDKEENVVRFLIRRAGNGTETLSKIKAGGVVNVILPLGNGFDYGKGLSSPLLVGGGVGIAPLLLLGKSMRADGIEPTFLFGGRKKDNLLRMPEFEKLGKVFTTTEDGSHGIKGFVTDHSILKDKQFDYIFACGPTPMMKAVARYAASTGTACQVSLEHKMACGIGACLCCVEQTNQGNVCVCKEGPVFTTDKLLWQD